MLCNGGVATELACMYIIEHGCGETVIDFAHDYSTSWLSTALLGSLACSCGDTLASELGLVIGSSDPWLITTLERVPRGNVEVSELLQNAVQMFLLGGK